ncbi:MAG: RpiB/LacA/LacB family sugar-phosphate isomerase [Bdellovibrionota bacterium]
MRVFIASDHAGFELKQLIQKSVTQISYLTAHAPEQGALNPPTKETIVLEWEDLGCPGPDRVDYPDIAAKLAEKIKDTPYFGILVCGSGIGVCIKANRYPWVRAGLAHNLETAQLARGHNDANVLCLGARFVESHLAIEMVRSFLVTPFEGGRHADRVKKL